MAARVNRGRQKIPLQKIENETYRSVTFSKRKSSILKKSSELCTLTGAEMAVIVRSAGNKTFSFGHPHVQAIVDRFLLVNPEPLANPYIANQFLGNFHTIIEGLNAEYTVVDEELMNCKQQRDVLTRTEKVCEAEQRYKRLLDGMDREEINSFERNLVKLHDIVAQRSEVLQQRQAQLMHQDATIGVGRGIRDFMPPSAALTGSFHEGVH